MKIDYTNLSFTQLIDKIEANRFFDLPRMVREAFRRLLTRVEALEDSPAPTGEFIPLTGTKVGSPVTGDIEIEGGNDLRIIQRQPLENNYRGALVFSDQSINMVSENDSDVGDFLLESNKLNINFSNPLSVGLTSAYDYSSNITDLDYTQKKYVDERGSVFNATTSVLSASDLNTAYPNAKDGFSVIAPNVVGGGKYYIKAGAGWVYQQILAVV
jgi:hypothetical protein